MKIVEEIEKFLGLYAKAEEVAKADIEGAESRVETEVKSDVAAVEADAAKVEKEV
jgi:hypothetical protein